MHVATGADAFDDLLPDIAALGEVERVLLISFLRQIAGAYVGAILRKPDHDAKLLQCLGAHWQSAGLDQ